MKKNNLIACQAASILGKLGAKKTNLIHKDKKQKWGLLGAKKRWGNQPLLKP